MSIAPYYHVLPEEYCRHLGGLRWSPNHDAVETEDGRTFALVSEIGLFLEGFAASRRLIHFGFVLHLLHLLGKGQAPHPARAEWLFCTFHETGRPLRNAGAFFAELCRHVPAVADPFRFNANEWLVQSSILWFYRVPAEEEVPPLSPAAFEDHVLRRLEAYQPKELKYWLRHGRGPIKESGEKIVREVVAVPPRALTDVLAELTQRERLAGAVPYVSRLVGALALPPRRLARNELPMGGYSDVATRGLPEQILPSQLALDDLEFLRRFAANELLFYRREEPHAQTKEELLLLLDQGVRTWGDVRLVLAAAVLALGRRVAKGKTALRLAATSSAGRPLDCRTADAAKLGELLEASDLTFHPGAALERVLEEPSDGLRDIVLLTHPRNLAESEVQAAARRVDKKCRLFAVTVDGHGQAELAELRHGVPVPRTRFHIDWEKTPPPEPESVPEAPPAAAFRGDVEPIGFPFRFGVTGPLGPFAFDGSGEWLLLSGPNGMLHVERTDGTGAEVLPRGFWKGNVLHNIEAVLGVPGGFVVCGRADVELLAMHYDLTRRRCAARVLGMPDKDRRQWFYLPRFHSVVLKGDAGNFGVDLATGERAFYKRESRAGDSRVQQACAEAENHALPAPALPIVGARTGLRHWNTPVLYYDWDGCISVRRASGEMHTFTPLADGLPFLKNHRPSPAQIYGNTLALCVTGPKPELNRLHVFRLPEGTPIADLPMRPSGNLAFALSPSEKHIARQTSDSMVVLHDISDGGGPVQIPLRGRYHTQLDVELGQGWLTVRVGGWWHLLCWNSGILDHVRGQGDDGLKLRERLKAARLPHPGAAVRSANLIWSRLGYDLKRFTAYAQMDGLTLVVDTFGQLIVLDDSQQLVCMFFVFRNQLAGWLPDGTRFGSAALTGGPETAVAAEKVGQALSAARHQKGAKR